MAIGLAFLLGFRFPQNFDAPYQAANISEFWRRWHMSLSFWLRDYLYLPLGGNRGSRAGTMRNLVVVMFLGGLWHGAAWTFVIWGLYHGALLAGHAVLRDRGWVPRARPLAVLATFLAVMIGWVFFRSSSLHQAMALLGVMFGLRAGEGGNLALVGAPLPWLLLGGGLAAAWLVPDTWHLKVPRSRSVALLLAILLLICALRFATPSPFLYFQF
jgi:alginate O-acetyltransferase complex protein AlgI